MSYLFMLSVLKGLIVSSSDLNISEYERMLAGQWFSWKDAEIQESLKKARSLVYRFNNTAPNDYDAREVILKELFGSMGEGCLIEAPFRCDWGKHIRIGHNVFVNYNCVFNDYGKITIGNDVLIAFNVLLVTSTHPVNPLQRRDIRNDGIKDITIGNNVWIGAGVVVLPGVTIGDHAVIGAGSVVTHDIGANSLAVGNPCRKIKQI